MALVTTGFTLAVVLSDVGGNKFNLRYDLTAADYATAATDRATILAALSAITNCAIFSHSLQEKYAESGTVFGTAEGENQAEFSVKLVAVGKPNATVKVPAPLATIFADVAGAGYNIVDPTDADVITYLALFEAGAECYLSDGDSARDSATAGNWAGKRVHIASRKG